MDARARGDERARGASRSRPASARSSMSHAAASPSSACRISITRLPGLRRRRSLEIRRTARRSTRARIASARLSNPRRPSWRLGPTCSRSTRLCPRSIRRWGPSWPYRPREPRSRCRLRCPRSRCRLRCPRSRCRLRCLRSRCRLRCLASRCRLRCLASPWLRVQWAPCLSSPTRMRVSDRPIVSSPRAPTTTPSRSSRSLPRKSPNAGHCTRRRSLRTVAPVAPTRPFSRPLPSKSSTRPTWISRS